jgi:hypothetical protein
LPLAGRGTAALEEYLTIRPEPILPRSPYLGRVTLHFGGETAFCQMESREKSNFRVPDYSGAIQITHFEKASTNKHA